MTTKASKEKPDYSGAVVMFALGLLTAVVVSLIHGEVMRIREYRRDHHFKTCKHRMAMAGLAPGSEVICEEIHR